MPKEEEGYWFSTENGTHIHAEEGESKKEAMGKKFGNFKKNSSLNFPSPTKEEHQATLDKEIKNTFRNREEGLRYLENQTKDWTDEEKATLKKRIDRVYPEEKDLSNYSDDISTPEKKKQWLKNRIEELNAKGDKESKEWAFEYIAELNALEDDLPMKVESRSIINEKQSNNPSKLADKIGNEENSMDKYKNMSLKEKWDAWKKFENSGDVETIDEMNELAESIESELPFKNEEEHQKWLDVYSSYKNVGEIDKLTAEIIGRKEPNKNLTTKEKWDKYNKIAFTGDVDDIDNANELLSQIENELPFKDEKEHQKWLELVSEDMGEGKVEALTEEILARKKEPKKQKLTSKDIPNVEDDLVSKDGNITLKEWFGKNSHQLQGEQENKDYVVEAMMDKFGLTKREAKNYYDEMFEK